MENQPTILLTAAAAAKSLQSCPTLCDHIDDSPPGSPVSGILQVVLVVKNSPVNAEDKTDEGLIPGFLQARTLVWVAISFSYL